MKTADAVRSLAACPYCHAGIEEYCRVKSGRNHAARVRAALVEALAQEAEVRGKLELAFGIRQKG